METDEPWRELLFAVSGLRQELGAEVYPGIGSPVLIVILESAEHAHRLRSLTELLSAQYVLFSRLELNIVSRTDELSDLDGALAPLLPRCRAALKAKASIGSEMLCDLADEVALSVRSVSSEVDELLRDSAVHAADAFAGALTDVVRPASDHAGPIQPFHSVELKNFRAFAEQAFPLGTVNVVEGLNGTGKSSLVEALEILWSGTSIRKPTDVRPEEYDRALVRDGQDGWMIVGNTEATGDAVSASRTSKRNRSVGRNVLVLEAADDVALSPSERRFSSLLEVTGLAIPALLATAEDLNREAKADLDRILSKLGIAPLLRRNARGIDHVRRGLRTLADRGHPPYARVAEAEAKLSEACSSLNIVYAPLGELMELRGIEELRDQAARLSHDLRTDSEFTEAVGAVQTHLNDVAGSAADRARFGRIGGATRFGLSGGVRSRVPTSRPRPRCSDRIGGEVAGHSGRPTARRVRASAAYWSDR